MCAPVCVCVPVRVPVCVPVCVCACARAPVCTLGSERNVLVRARMRALQLENGVRGLMLDAHKNAQGEMILCHGPASLCERLARARMHARTRGLLFKYPNVCVHANTNVGMQIHACV